jgi:flagellar M-ring protein FliF
MSAIDVDKLKEQGRRFASGFTTGQKTVTIAAIVGVFVAMFMFTKWAGRPDYAPLFTDLDSKAAGEVTQALDSEGVSYKLTDGGATVMVPKGDLYQTRADLSTKGVPQASTDGWSIMDQGGITKDEFSKRVDYQRALQSELSKTISAIDGIDGATVNLTIPQQSVFVDAEDDQASAAVLVTPMTGTTLSAEKVQAIVNLVSSSVPSLKPEKVTVADSLGNVLSAPGQESEVQGSHQVEQRNAFEADLSNKLEALIAASLGPGHSAITVSADLDFDKTQQKRTTFNQPGGKNVPTQQQITNETYTGPASGSTGVLGPDGTPLTGGTATGTNYTKKDTTSEYAVNQVIEETNKAPGAIRGLSIAGLLDSSKVTQADLTKWTRTISAAAGINTKRGDVVNVNLVKFDTTAAKAAAAQVKEASAAKSQDFLLNLLRYVVTLAIVGAVLFLAWRSVKRAGVVTGGTTRVPLDLRELEAADLVGGRLDSTYERAQVGASGGGGGRRLSLEAAPSDASNELNDLIERQPDEVAQTLRSWLADRRT